MGVLKNGEHQLKKMSLYTFQINEPIVTSGNQRTTKIVQNCSNNNSRINELLCTCSWYYKNVSCDYMILVSI
jgi:hypothetical protein